MPNFTLKGKIIFKRKTTEEWQTWSNYTPADVTYDAGLVYYTRSGAPGSYVYEVYVYNVGTWSTDYLTLFYATQVLDEGQPGFNKTDKEAKTGNGVHTWDGLASAITSSAKDVANGVVGADSYTKATPALTSAYIRTETGSFALPLNYAGQFVNMDSASNLTITIPLNVSVAFPIGTEIEICRYGTGTVTLAGSVTIVCKETARTIADQYTSAILKKMDTDTWLLQGNIG